MKFETKIVTPTNNKGDAVKMTAKETASAGGALNPAYSPIAPGTYFGVVTKMETGTHRAPSGQYRNVNSQDGLWEYIKLIPTIKLLNQEGTEISRQEFTLGVMENGEFVRPDGKSQTPIWIQGQYLLTALGCFSVDPNDEASYKLEYNDELITDRVARFKVSNAAYIKDPRFNFDVGQMQTLLTAVNKGKAYSFAEMNGLVTTFNNMSAEELAKLPGFNALQAELIVAGRSSGDSNLRVKNVVIACYAITAEDAADHDWFYDDTTGAVYTNPAAWAAAAELAASIENYIEPNL